MEVFRKHGRKIWRDSGFALFQPRAIRSKGKRMEQANKLFDESKPILEHLLPFGIERWRAEKLFKRVQRDGIEYSVGKKMRFVMFCRAKYWDAGARDVIVSDAKQSGITRSQISAEKHQMVRSWFNAATDTQMRDIAREMICAENIISARYVCRRMGHAWEQFVMDFNAALEEVMAAAIDKGIWK